MINNKRNKPSDYKIDWTVLIFVVCLNLLAGCVFHKTEIMGALEKGNYGSKYTLKGNHEEIAKRFLVREKDDMPVIIELHEKDPVLGGHHRGRVHGIWNVTTFSKDGHNVTRVLCREYESLIIVDYKYVVDFIQINPTKVQAELYGSTYSGFLILQDLPKK